MKNLSLNQKIIGLISLFFIGNLIVATYGIIKIQEINNSLNELVDVTAQRLFIAKEMESITHQIRNREKVFILEETQEGMKEEVKKLDLLEDNLKKEFDKYEGFATEAGKKDIAKLRTILDEWKAVSLELRKLSYNGQNKEATAMARGASRVTMEKFAEVSDGLVTRNKKIMADESVRTDELVALTIKMITIVSVLALVIGATLSFLIMRAMSNAINEVISNLNDSSNQVASASSQIAASSEELSQATTEQAASLEETASSVEEMSSMINRNTDNARQASENSLQCQRNAMKGKETVNEMIQSIDEINDSNNRIMEQINHSNGQLADIVKVISEIENKTKVINDIVFQTKLLSFNASVEAARAGEHGKGFAVVAEEVGNLAAMSGNAAKEISTMLEESIHKVESIVTETKTSVDKLISDGKRKVENGTRVAKSCGVVLDEIVESVSKVSSMAEEISTASVEQSQGITEITKAMHQLDQVTQQNASASHEAASSAEELSAQAVSLKVSVGVLISTIKGGEQSADKHSYVAPVRKSTPAPVTASATLPAHKAENVIKLNKPKAKPDNKAKTVALKKTGTDNDKTPSYNDDRFQDV